MSARAALVACVVLASPCALAQARPEHHGDGAEHTSAAARRRFDHLVTEAQAAYAAGDAARAVEALEHAYTLRADPTLLFNMARANELGGRLAEAIEDYERFLATTPSPELADQAASLRATASAALAAQRAVRVVAVAPPTPHPRATPHGRAFGALPVALVAGGGALLVTGAILGGLALGASSRFAATEDPSMRAALQDRANGLAWGADAGIGLGAALAALGFVVYLVQPVAH